MSTSQNPGLEPLKRLENKAANSGEAEAHAILNLLDDTFGAEAKLGDVIATLDSLISWAERFKKAVIYCKQDLRGPRSPQVKTPEK